MNLIINGQPRTFEDLHTFREHHTLPDTFGVAQFEPKDYTGLARIDQAGPALNRVRETVLSAIPEPLEATHLPIYADLLTKTFQMALLNINEEVNLKPVEVDFAVEGFRGVISAVTFALIRARVTKDASPTFIEIYGTWLSESVRVSAQVHPFTHNGTTWQIQIVNTMYGRAGLVITTTDETYYVADASLGCPAEGFMYNLLKSATEKIIMAAPD